MPDNSSIALSFDSSGKAGKGTLSAMLGGEVIFTDFVNITAAKDRARFARTLCKGRRGIDRKALDKELETLAAGAVRDAGDGRGANNTEAAAVDVSRIVRPELIITPEVRGIAIAETFIDAGKPAGRWRWYLCWQDGRREVRELENFIELPSGTRLWIHPQPSAPSANIVPGWSAEGRRTWLAGGPAPDLADVFRRLCKAIEFYIDFPDNESAAVTATLALWTMLSYVFFAWPAVRYLYIGGPLSSGKSRVFDVLLLLLFRALASSNITAAALFRTLHERGGALLMDEAERLKDQTPDASDLRSILLAGYKRGGKATRLEAVGDTFKTVEFDCYSPKAIACIGGLPPALASRCITITMFRAAPDSPMPARRVDAEPQRWAALRDDLHALALGPLGRAAIELAGWADVCNLGGRDYELWQPLMSLAAMIEAAGVSGLLGQIQEHAAAVAEANKDDETPDADELLLRLLADAVRDNLSAPTPGEILDKARQAEPESFKRWTARGVAARLKRYGLAAVKSGGQRSYRDVTLADFRRIQRNYKIDLNIPDTPSNFAPQPSQPPQNAVPKTKNALFDGAQTGTVGTVGTVGAQKLGDTGAESDDGPPVDDDYALAEAAAARREAGEI